MKLPSTGQKFLTKILKEKMSSNLNISHEQEFRIEKSCNDAEFIITMSQLFLFWKYREGIQQTVQILDVIHRYMTKDYHKRSYTWVKTIYVRNKLGMKVNTETIQPIEMKT